LDSILNSKADAAEYTATIELKANQTDIYTRTYLDSQFDSKADSAEYTAIIALKADQSDIYTRTYLDSQFDSKADAAEYTAIIALKADQADIYTRTYLNSQLASKANAADVYTKTEIDTAISTETLAVSGSATITGAVYLADESLVISNTTLISTATSPKTITLSDTSGTIVIVENIGNNGEILLSNGDGTFSWGDALTSTAGGSQTTTSNTLTLSNTTIVSAATQARTITMPDRSGIVVVTDDGTASVSDVYTTSYLDSQLDSKADAAEYTAAIALKADQSDIYTRTYLDSQLDSKANAAEYTSAIALKANQSDIYTRTYLDSQLDSKADQSDIYTRTFLDSQLNLKADASDVYTKTEIDTSVSTGTLAVSGPATITGAVYLAEESLVISNTTLVASATQARTITMPDQSGIVVLSNDGKISTSEINDNAITSGKIADGAIVGDDLADGTIYYTQLADNSINNTKIAGSGNDDQVLVSDNAGNSSWEYINNEIQTFTVSSGQTVTAGDIVKLVNGSVQKGVTTTPLSSEFTTYNDGDTNKVVALDGTTFVVITIANNDEGYATVGSINGLSITYGSNYQFHVDVGSSYEYNYPHNSDSNTCYYVDPGVAKLSSSKIVIVYQDDDDSDNGKAIIGTISGNTISWGAAYEFNASDSNLMSVAALSDTSFVISFQDEDYGGDNTNIGMAIVGNVSGTTITFGNKFVYNNASTDTKDIVALDENTIVIVYQDEGNSNKATAIAGAVNGLTITWGSETIISVYETTNIAISAIDDNRFIIAYDLLDKINDGISIMGEVSGTDISWGTKNTFVNGFINYIDISVLSNNHVMVAFQNMSNNKDGTLVFGKITSDSVIWGSTSSFNNYTTTNIDVAPIGSSQYIIVYEDYGDAEAGHSLIATLPEIYPTVGVAMENGTGGNEIKVATSGLIDTLSGLTSGIDYYSDENGSLTTSITDRFIGTSISSTALQLKSKAPGDAMYLKKTGDSMSGTLHLNSSLTVKEDAYFSTDLLVEDIIMTNGIAIANDYFKLPFGDSHLNFEGDTDDDYEHHVYTKDPTQDRYAYLPDATGTFVLSSSDDGDLHAQDISGISSNGTSGQVLLSDGNGSFSWGKDFSMSSTAYIIVETTDNAVTNGTNLIAAYTLTKALTPHGEALSITNRAALIVPPGRYNLGTSELVLDTEYVDLVGLSTARDNQYIYGTSNGPNTGVIRQTAQNVHIENLVVECTRSSGGTNWDNTDPAAYFPAASQAESHTNTIIRNCEFKADDNYAMCMRIGITYAGTYENCTAEENGFGGYQGSATGVFKNCNGGYYGFCGYESVVSGTFINCTADNNSFGGAENSIVSGTFINCTADYCSFGGGTGSIASGTFKNCIAAKFSFGYEGIASGKFTDCTGGEQSFGYNGEASGKFTDCTGGDESFGTFGDASGIFNSCTGGIYAFGGRGHISSGSGTASGTFINCTAGDYAFGTTATGIFYNCIGGDYSFAARDTASGTFTNCTGGLWSFGGRDGTASGTFRNCTAGDWAFGGFNDSTGGFFWDCVGGTDSFGHGGKAKDCYDGTNWIDADPIP
jgi:hypothetical protein